MSKLKDKKLSLPLGSSAVTGGRKPLVRHSSVNLSVNCSGSSGLGSGATPTNQTKATRPTSPSRGGVVVIGGESDVPHFGFSSKTFVCNIPLLARALGQARARR